ncbi:hypothetical protein [Bradyrhizobium sp. 153]|uniref:hypothetical protein n=1 Tax=Bradyrhizobium sp. 153 TaxID=2782627 RepID=UPI001FFA3179|nr:hypothetical protein [Bradyrhizobium sp. 153]MCK1668619.1 hypothetical protein [Bradyrhizobium sp. 153]
MSNETLLTISGPGMNPYAARGLTQTLDPINAAASLRRTINGKLRDLSQPQFRKYTSTITSRDQIAPPLDGVWPGDLLTVGCVAELSYPTAGGAPQRTPVAGSSRTDGSYTFYRPSLLMRVMSYTTQEDEYGRVVSWSLVLEED